MARRHASTADFELVGLDDDPTPGDTELIQAVLQRYSDIGDAAEKALNVLKKGGSIDSGRGSAMDALKKKIGDDLPDKLAKTVRSYHDAAQAYRDYIPRLQEAQDTFDRAVDQAQAAAPAANQTPPTPSADAGDDDKAAATKAQDAIDQGKSQLSAAKSLAEQAKTMRQTAQRACADVLDRAAKEAIPERNIFQKIADFFKDFPFVQILLGILIAIVSVFFPVAGALLGGALFLITEIPAIASGKFSLGDLLTGLIGLVPGGALLKAGGGLFKAGVGAAAKAFGKGAKSIDGPLSGIGSSAAKTKAVGGSLDNTAVRTAGSVVKEFGENAGEETLNQAIDGQGFDPTAIATAGVLAAVGGGALKGIGKKFAPPKNGRLDQGTATRSSGPGEAGPSSRGIADDERFKQTPTPDLNTDPVTLPNKIERKPGDGRPVFNHPKAPGIDLILHQTDPEGFKAAVFKEARTGQLVVFDTDDGKFKKFDGGFGTDSTQELADFHKKPAGPIPTDHFPVDGFEGANLPRITSGDLTQLPADGSPALVKTSLLDGIPIRGNLNQDRLNRVTSGINGKQSLPPIVVSADGRSIVDGNHRIQATKNLGLDFIPARIDTSVSLNDPAGPAAKTSSLAGSSVDRPQPHDAGVGSDIPATAPPVAAPPTPPPAPPVPPDFATTKTPFDFDTPPSSPAPVPPPAPPVPPGFATTKTPFDFDEDSD